MGYILAQMTDELAYDPVLTIVWLVLLFAPLVLVFFLIYFANQYNRRVRSHIDRAERHMERVDSLLERIAANTEPSPE